jgi:hypothetical protein
VSPGFIGVGAGAWSDPLPAPTPYGGVEVYYIPYPDPQMYVGKQDGTVTALGDPLPGTNGLPMEVVSFGARQNVVVLATNDEAPPFAYRYSTDAGVTWTVVPYLATPITGFPGQDASSPAHLAAPRDWWVNVGSGGEGGSDGGLFRAADGPASAAYVLWGQVDWANTFALGGTRIYVLTNEGGGGDPWHVWASPATASGTFTDIGTVTETGLTERGQAGDCCILMGYESFGISAVTFHRAVGDTLSTPSGLPSSALDCGYIDANGSVLMLTTVAAGGAATIWKSTDQGATWASVKTWTIPDGLGLATIAPPLTAVPAQPGVWWAGWAHDPGIDGDDDHPPVSGWWRTADDGATWAIVAAPAPSRWYYHGAGHPIIDIAGGPGGGEESPPPTDPGGCEAWLMDPAHASMHFPPECDSYLTITHGASPDWPHSATFGIDPGGGTVFDFWDTNWTPGADAGLWAVGTWRNGTAGGDAAAFYGTPPTGP